MGTQPVYRERRSGKQVDAIGHTRILKSSNVFQWSGLQLEVGQSSGWNVDDLMVDGHLIGFNLGNRDLHYRLRSETDWKTACLPSRSFWIRPEGKPFSIEHHEELHYAGIFVDGRFLDEIAGQHFELHEGNGLVDRVLAGTVDSLVGVLYDDRPYSQKFVDQLIRTFVHGLATRYGYAAGACVKGGIAPVQLRSLLIWVEENLQSPLTVSSMASRVGLSAAHFSREFKRSTGHTPWEHVVQLRLEGARQHLEAGVSATEVALRYGFSDQSHLGRLFKVKYGLTPSSFVRMQRN